MNTISINQAQMNLSTVVQRVLHEMSPTIVMAENGESVVMLPLNEYNAWKETLYLLSTPANAEHLRRSIAEDKAAYRTAHALIDA